MLASLVRRISTRAGHTTGHLLQHRGQVSSQVSSQGSKCCTVVARPLEIKWTRSQHAGSLTSSLAMHSAPKAVLPVDDHRHHRNHHGSGGGGGGRGEMEWVYGMGIGVGSGVWVLSGMLVNYALGVFESQEVRNNKIRDSIW
jgi:hypothetical protein